MRDAREIFSALKSNVDQIMSSLQEGLMLFTSDSRVVLVSASVERFLGRSRAELLGRDAKEIFSAESPIGALMLDAFRLRHNIAQREIEMPMGPPRRGLLDFIQEKGTQIGALLTVRDAESVPASRMKSNFPAAFPPAAGSPAVSPMKSRTRSTPSFSTFNCCATNSSRWITTPTAT